MPIIRLIDTDGSIHKLEAIRDQNLLQFLIESGYNIFSPCGRKGICGKCKVRILQGQEVLAMPYLPSKTITESEWGQGYRLACRLIITDDLLLEAPSILELQADIMTSGSSYDAPLNPKFYKKYLTLAQPSLEDQTSDVDRLQNELFPSCITHMPIIRDLSNILKKNNYGVTAVVLENEIIAVEGGDTTGKQYGVALDLGTTTIAGVLINLVTGKEEYTYTALNPQKQYGDDVISRIDFTMAQESGLRELSELVINEINKMLETFRQQLDISLNQIYHMLVVGNTVMLHILAGISVESIATAPFIPVMTGPLDIKASEHGINIFPQGVVTLAPMVAGYVGADTTSAILACGMDQHPRISLMIDIGTNGEMALGNNERMMVCSTAAGPAFEGGHLHCGLGGIYGAINKIEISQHAVGYTTLGNEQPRGICGSGVIDGVAQMLRSKLLEPTGRMLTCTEASLVSDERLASRIGEHDGKPSFLIVSKEEGALDDIILTQKDIREVQLAKASIAAGIRVLMDEMGVAWEDIDQVYLAGGFGNYIDYKHAVEIGLIPEELKQKIVPIGNGALTGAKMMLVSKTIMARANQLRKRIQYVELSSSLEFQNRFIDEIVFE